MLTIEVVWALGPYYYQNVAFQQSIANLPWKWHWSCLTVTFNEYDIDCNALGTFESTNLATYII